MKTSSHILYKETWYNASCYQNTCYFDWAWKAISILLIRKRKQCQLHLYTCCFDSIDSWYGIRFLFQHSKTLFLALFLHFLTCCFNTISFIVETAMIHNTHSLNPKRKKKTLLLIWIHFWMSGSHRHTLYVGIWITLSVQSTKAERMPKRTERESHRHKT